MLIAIGLLGVVTAVAIPNFVQARKHGNEASAISALHSIAMAQTKFREGDLEKDGKLDYGMLSELAGSGLLEEEVGFGARRGYVFEAAYSLTTSEFLWAGVANPEPGHGDRVFAINQTGVILYRMHEGVPLRLDVRWCVLSGVVAVSR